MAGTPAGGQKAVAKIKARDPDFFHKIGAAGGRKKNPLKGYGGMPKEKAVAAGRKGGSKSKRIYKPTELEQLLMRYVGDNHVRTLTKQIRQLLLDTINQSDAYVHTAGDNSVWRAEEDLVKRMRKL